MKSARLSRCCTGGKARTYNASPDTDGNHPKIIKAYAADFRSKFRCVPTASR